jgi:hypothetical protein
MIFAGMIAHPPYGGWEGVVFLDHLQSFLIAARLDQGNIALCAGLRRTSVFAGACASLRYEKGIRHGLRVGNVDCLSLVQSLVEFVRQIDWTDLCAVIAAGAFLQVNITGTFPDLSLKITGLSFEGKQLAIGDDLDVEMTACLNQLRREDTHGAIVGGKGLVKL